jgi:Coenzyme PQQ synthesis protein D (PqqD)
MTRITLEHTFVLSKDAVFRDLDGEAVILDLAAGTYFGLNAVGTRMWQLLERHGRLQEVHDALREEYDVAPDLLERDLLGLVARLVEARLGDVKQPE